VNRNGNQELNHSFYVDICADKFCCFILGWRIFIAGGPYGASLLLFMIAIIVSTLLVEHKK
jgi:hypothetical protein